MFRTLPARPCSDWKVALSAQFLSGNQASTLLTCRCCNLEVSTNEACQHLEGLLQEATTREEEQQHRQQGSVVYIPNAPPSE